VPQRQKSGAFCPILSVNATSNPRKLSGDTSKCFGIAPKKSGYFPHGLQVHFFAGFLQPEQTLSSIALPHFLHAVHPHD
jgi:hypothetical protein